MHKVDGSDTMAYCTNCGQQVADNAKFCANCGTPIASANDGERKTFYDGEIHKCPHCGEVLKAFETICPTCKFELRGAKAVGSVREFAFKLENVNSEEKRIELIKNFYIPNTKEDIYEFFIYAMSNLNSSVREAEAWQVKLEQTYHKAKLSFGDTAEFQYIHSLYLKTSKEHNKKMLKHSIAKRWKVILCIVLGIISLSMILIGGFLGYESGDPNSPYHMMSVIGMFPGLAIVFIAVGPNDKNKRNK